MNSYKKWATTGVVLSIVGVLAGCGTGGGAISEATPAPNVTNTVSNTTNSTAATNNVTTSNETTQKSNQTTSTNNTVTSGDNGTHSASFPGLIQQGMQSISQKTTIPLYAPTTYPGSAHTPLPVTISTSVGSSPTANYSLMFNRNKSNIGGFSVYDWSTANTASQHLLPANTGLYIESTVPSTSTMNLGNGIESQVKKSAIEGKKVSALDWNEGRWTMEVLYPTISQNEGVTIAERIVQYCNSSFLPVPNTKGYVLVNLASGNATTYVSWDKGQYVFNTNSDGAWNSNLSGGYISAIAMAVSTKAY